MPADDAIDPTAAYRAGFTAAEALFAAITESARQAPAGELAKLARAYFDATAGLAHMLDNTTETLVERGHFGEDDLRGVDDLVQYARDMATGRAKVEVERDRLDTTDGAATPPQE